VGGEFGIISVLRTDGEEKFEKSLVIEGSNCHNGLQICEVRNIL
jgi:hypothetical protein